MYAYTLFHFFISTSPSGGSDTAESSAMHEDGQNPSFEVHPDDESGSVRTEHSECNKVPAEGAKLPSMCISGELSMHVTVQMLAFEEQWCVDVYARCWVAIDLDLFSIALSSAIISVGGKDGLVYTVCTCTYIPQVKNGD